MEEIRQVFLFLSYIYIIDTHSYQFCKTKVGKSCVWKKQLCTYSTNSLSVTKNNFPKNCDIR